MNRVGGCESSRKSGCEAAFLVDEPGKSVSVASLMLCAAVCGCDRRGALLFAQDDLDLQAGGLHAFRTSSLGPSRRTRDRLSVPILP